MFGLHQLILKTDIGREETGYQFTEHPLLSFMMFLQIPAPSGVGFHIESELSFNGAAQKNKFM